MDFNKQKSMARLYGIVGGLVLVVAASGTMMLLYAQDSVTQQLPNQPEWVEIQQGDRIVHTYQVRPGHGDRSVAVVVIHENRGLTEWVQSVTDRLAEEGYFALAPDLLSGMAPGGGRTIDFPNEDAARNAINALPQAQVNADIMAVAEYARSHSASNGKVSIVGFCWGGGQAFTYATLDPELIAAFVFYGSPPSDPNTIATINCPVYGFYGGNDARITETVPQTEAQMNAAAKQFEPVVYDGAGHAFMRTGEDPGASNANIQAREMAWERWLTILNRLQSHVMWSNQ